MLLLDKYTSKMLLSLLCRGFWGIDLRMFQLLGEKFNFRPTFSLRGPNIFNATIRRFVSGPFHEASYRTLLVVHQ